MSEFNRTPNVIDRLKEDHDLVKALLSDLMFRNPEVREDAFFSLVTELVKHEVAEEMVVYPAIRSDAPDGMSAVERRLNEQSAAEEKLATMEKMDVRSSEFTAEINELNRAVLNHAKAEEQTIFPLLTAIESRDALIELGDHYAKARTSAPTHPHPLAPDTPPGNQVLGPIAALFDRTRDAIRRS